jgi:predicted flap endonuclease-1-like 5' DNA nuclease
MGKRLWMRIARRMSLAGALGILVWWFLRRYLEQEQVTAEYPIPTVSGAVDNLPDKEPDRSDKGQGSRIVVTAKAPVVGDKPVPDNLRLIEGIGPRISSVLADAGIITFAQLAATGVDRLRQLLADAGVRIAYPDTWPEQAALAAAGSWEDLRRLQSQLDRGRRVEPSS